MAEGISARLKIDEARKFGLVVGAAFLALGALLWWRGRRMSPLVFGAIGAALILLGVVLPSALVQVRRIWMGAAERISRVTTPIFMGVVYFGILTPIGVLRRRLGHSPLEQLPGNESLWVVRDAGTRKPEDMEHQF
jgi:hypothetical protein